MYKNDLVSIVVPSLNSAKFINETIESALSQTHKNIEIIIIDNNSQDGTREVIEGHMVKDNRVRSIFLDTVNRAGPTRNIGIQAARGRYLAFLDSDDLWRPDKLEKQIKHMNSQGLSFSFTGYEVINESNLHVCNVTRMPERLNYDDFLKNTCVATSSVLIDRVVIEKFEFLDRAISEDYPTWLSLLKCGYNAGGLSGEYLRYRVVPSSLSSKKAKAARFIWNVFRNEERLSLVKASYCFGCYSCRAILKNLKMKRL